MKYNTIMTKKFKKMILDKTLFPAFVFMVLGVGSMKAQVTVGALTLPRATLDVVASKTDGSTAEGIIVPRVDRLALNKADSAGVYASAQEDAILYVSEAHNGTQTGQEINVDDEGYYYFDGSVWVHLVSTDVRETHVINDASTLTLGMPITMTAAANYVAQDTDYVVVANGTANQTVTLPDAVGRKGKVYTVIDLNNGSTITISAVNGQSIMFLVSKGITSTPTFKLTSSSQVGATVQSNGTNWILLNTAAQVSSY